MQVDQPWVSMAKHLYGFIGDSFVLRANYFNNWVSIEPTIVQGYMDFVIMDNMS